MKNWILLVLLSFSMTAFSQEINWLSLEEAEKEMKKNPDKLLFIDFYTDWCGWCKKMDNSTFKEPEVIEAINKNYIAVKFDAESKKEVKFRGKTYSYVTPPVGGRGVNSFAYFSLRGQLSYPAYAVLSQEGRLENLLLGFMPKDRFLERLSQEQ